ncbi:hypothetical protein PRIPAC_94381 [Pristionchus pacificus]|uniref:Uncharacterized protein n=1 Tax=Pristionchus pacificus TaxID=54126 RepID=A0A2A6BQE3_PRIPA|nr:hypothetical protein PRIPAC_94381 [Pristionchus pacificus]|eukprot:PDM68134.1 hypothetical protein PRIPAC_46178 [Pristionchus pacificus]
MTNLVATQRNRAHINGLDSIVPLIPSPSLFSDRFSQASERLAMDKVKATVKPLYAQAASIGVTVLLWILLVVTVAVDVFAVKEEYGIKIIEDGLTTLGFKSAKPWAQASYILLIFTILFQIAALACHGLFFKMPNLKPKLFIALIVINALTFFISALALGLWDSNFPKLLRDVSRGTSYNCIGACIFFEILNFLLLALLKIVGVSLSFGLSREGAVIENHIVRSMTDSPAALSPISRENCHECPISVAYPTPKFEPLEFGYKDKLPLFLHSFILFSSILIFSLLISAAAKDEFATVSPSVLNMGESAKRSVGLGFALDKEKLSEEMKKSTSFLVDTSHFTFENREKWAQASLILISLAAFFEAITVIIIVVSILKETRKKFSIIGILVLQSLILILSAIVIGMWEANADLTPVLNSMSHLKPTVSNGLSFINLATTIALSIANMIQSLSSMDLDVTEFDQIQEDEELRKVKKHRFTALVICFIVTGILLSAAIGIDHWGTDSAGNKRSILSVRTDFGQYTSGYSAMPEWRQWFFTITMMAIVAPPVLTFLIYVFTIVWAKNVKIFGLFLAYTQVIEICLLWTMIGLWCSLGDRDDFHFGPSFYITIATLVWTVIQMPFCAFFFVILELMTKNKENHEKEK